MSRIPYSKRIYDLRDTVKNNPGIRKGSLRILLGYKYYADIENVLSACEANRIWLSEDDEGRIYTWKIEDSE